MSNYDINDKVFNLNQFIEGKGGTKRVRLDELNALRAGHEAGDMSVVGDASACDIVDWLLKRAGVVGHPLFAQLAEAFAEAILRVAGDEPYLWVNPQAGHAARRIAGLLEPDDLVNPDFSHERNGYPKPTDEEAEETRKAQEEATRQEAIDKLAEEKKATGKAAPAKGTSAKGGSSKTDGGKEDPELKKLLGDGDK